MKAILVIEVGDNIDYQKDFAKIRLFTSNGRGISYYDKVKLKPLPSRVDNLDLEVWNSRNGSMLAPKGLFNEIYNDKEDDDKENW